MKLKIINNIDDMTGKQILRFFDGKYSKLNLLNGAFLFVRYFDKKADVLSNNLNKSASFMYAQSGGCENFIYGKAILVTNYRKRINYEIKNYK